MSILNDCRVERYVRWTRGQYGPWATDVLFGLGARYGVRPFRLVVFSIADHCCDNEAILYPLLDCAKQIIGRMCSDNL